MKPILTIDEIIRIQQQAFYALDGRVMIPGEDFLKLKEAAIVYAQSFTIKANVVKKQISVCGVCGTEVEEYFKGSRCDGCNLEFNPL